MTKRKIFLFFLIFFTVKWIFGAEQESPAYYVTDPATRSNFDDIFNLYSELSEKIDSIIPVGTVVSRATSTVPADWLLCDGSTISRTTYAELFSAIGTNFGVGDGSTTFCIPDLRGRSQIGYGTGDGLSEFTLGQSTGSETLSVAQMPEHTHTFAGTEHNHTQNAHGHDLKTATTGSGGTAWPVISSAYDATNYTFSSSNQGQTTATNQATTAGGTNSNSGSGAKFRTPSLVFGFIIRYR